MKRKDRGAHFIRSNLELLGFGTPRDALVQAVKELFENALDATQSLGSNCSWEDAPLELLRVNVDLNEDTGCVDIVCADTGSGMRAHQVKLLCCNAFETTKTRSDGGGGCTSGKYGVGLKAAMLYSQLNAPDACLKITTTSSSDGILYVQLRIDPDSEETAVVKKVAQFVVDEEHQRFSGTESLRYTAPPFVGVQFSFDVGEVSISVDCQHGEEPIDRFAADLGVNADDILYAVHDEEAVSISCLGVMLGKMEPSGQCDIEICLLRYANHAPLINGDDIFICGITKGVKSSKLWKKYGLRCQRTSLHVVNQLVAAPLRASAAQAIEHADSPARLVLAIDISIGGSERSSGLKYGNLKKSILDASYTGDVQTCCSLILQQLADAGLLRTPQQLQDRELLENFAPLISRSIAAIVMQPQKGKTEGKVSKQQHESSSDHFNEELIQQELQAVLRNW
ncbi:dna topoisomerase vi subunit b [Phytophthora cinnamomi]|uniref:dna topoisomerase vi subunit b n=1 Tax=Phytophthora cinnamomi TaxID=4785 RepID=UPI0035598337|nr:dna topoisomerase vi subunit b [Phytophthora cinnamomi]